MSEGICPVQWAGSQAVVTLPEEIDTSNADQVREQLSLLINQGAAVLVADLSSTIACDYSGMDALLRVHGRAALSGTEFRLVVGSDIVRWMLTLCGLDRLVPVYPSLEGATGAGDRCQLAQEAPAPGELLDSVLNSIFQVSMILQAAAGLSPDLTTRRVSEALRHLDDVVLMVRNHQFAEPEHRAGHGLQPSSRQSTEERLTRAARNTVLFRERVVQAACAMQFAAADTAALLERRAELVEPPAHIDYATEIEGWRDFAQRAKEMARRWEQGGGTAP